MKDKINVEKIYLDMDGVLANFDKGVIDLLGLTPLVQGASTKEENDILWKHVAKYGHFYNDLEICDDALKLFLLLIGKYGKKVEILSAIPKKERGVIYAKEDKINWFRRNFSKNTRINIVLRKEKSKFCKGKEYILIDDFFKTTNEWEKLGGTAICHKNFDDTVKQLKERGIL